jgi:hypothetical protein
MKAPFISSEGIIRKNLPYIAFFLKNGENLAYSWPLFGFIQWKHSSHARIIFLKHTNLKKSVAKIRMIALFHLHRSVASGGETESSLICRYSSGVMSISRDLSESSNCSVLRAPMIGAVTAG